MAQRQVIFTIGANTQRFDKAIGKSMAKMRNFGKNMKRLGRGMSRNITAPLAAIGVASFKVAAEFGQAMAKVKAVSGATGAEFAKLEGNAKELGRTTVFTAREVAGLQLEFAKLGFSAAEIKDVTKSTLALAQATGSDLAQAAEVAGSTLRGFGLETSETERVTDVMAAAFSSSALDMESFKQSMKNVAPVAKSAGMSIEQTTAMLAAMANSGIKGSRAGTALRRIISELGATGGDVAGAIKKLADEGIGLADAKDEVGRSAQSAILILAEEMAQVDELTGAFKNSAGAAQAMADIQDATSMGAMKRMTSAIEGAQIALGEALAPTMEMIAKKIEKVALWFAELDEGTQTTVITIAAIVAAIGPMLVILPQLGAALGAAFTAMTGPVGLAILAIAAIVGAIFYFWDDVKRPLMEVANFFIEIWNEVNFVRILIAVLGQVWITQFKAIWFAIKEVGKAFGLIFRAIKAAFTDGFGAAWDVLKEGFSDMIDSTIEFGEDIYDSFAGAVTSAREANPVEFVTEEDMDAAKARIMGLLSFGGGGGGGGGGEVAGGGGAGVSQFDQIDTTKTLAGGYQEVADSAAEMNKQIGISINMGAMVESTFAGIGVALGSMAAGTMTGSEIMVRAIQGLGEMLINLGSQFIAAGLAATAFYANLVANPVLAVAAGVALVAAGVLIKESQNKMTSQPPRLAKGGLAFGPTLATVGDNPGARSNPEVIAPLDKLQSMMNTGGQNVTVTGKISGRDIMLTSERNFIDRNRVRGF